MSFKTVAFDVDVNISSRDFNIAILDACRAERSDHLEWWIKGNGGSYSLVDFDGEMDRLNVKAVYKTKTPVVRGEEDTY